MGYELRLAQALKAIKVPDDKIELLIEAMDEHMDKTAESKIDRLAVRMDKLEVRIDGIEQRMVNGFAHIEEQFANVNAKFTGVHAQFDNVSDQFANMRDSIKNSKTQLTLYVIGGMFIGLGGLSIADRILSLL